MRKKQLGNPPIAKGRLNHQELAQHTLLFTLVQLADIVYLKLSIVSEYSSSFLQGMTDYTEFGLLDTLPWKCIITPNKTA